MFIFGEWGQQPTHNPLFNSNLFYNNSFQFKFIPSCPDKSMALPYREIESHHNKESKSDKSEQLTDSPLLQMGKVILGVVETVCREVVVPTLIEISKEKVNAELKSAIREDRKGDAVILFLGGYGLHKLSDN